MRSKQGQCYDLNGSVDYRFSNGEPSLFDVKFGSRVADVNRYCLAEFFGSLFNYKVF